MPDLRARLRETLGGVGEDTTDGCGCVASVEGECLVVNAADCPHGGRLESSPECRAAAIDTLTERDVETVRTETDGLERVYADEAAALLVASGRFAERTAFHDERLARRTHREPLAACREATGRAGAVADIAAETGLAAFLNHDIEDVLEPTVGPTVSRWRVDETPPPDARLLDVRDLETGGTVRRYAQDGRPTQYHLDPLESQLSAPALAVLAAAYRRLGSGEFAGGERAPARAVRAVLGEEDTGGRATVDVDALAEHTVEDVARVLEKHTRGYGLLEDLFADPSLSDAFVTAPATANPLRVRVDGETLETNVRVTDGGIAALASCFRRESGRAFSRADPTLDATTTIAGRRVRVAGVTEPTSVDTAFAFRAHDREVWTLPALVGNETLTAEAAALLSLAVERGRAVLLAGPRGAGKTTMLGSLLWELPPAVRQVVIEDTPELPVTALQEAGRDVQPLRASDETAELTPAAALRTALRLGDGALAVGEVRGEEAGVLYEAMRVGANSEAVLGTIHGDGADAVYERVVTDLGVSPSAFDATDLVVTLEIAEERTRRVRCIEEVSGADGESPSFHALFERPDERLRASGRIDRGNSRLVATLAGPEESYATVRECLDARERLLEELARRERTSGQTVTETYHGRGR